MERRLHVRNYTSNYFLEVFQASDTRTWTLHDAQQELMRQKDLSPCYENEMIRYFKRVYFRFFVNKKSL